MMMLRYFLPFTDYEYKGEVSHCPVCDEDEVTNICNLDRNLKLLPTVMCNHCGLVFTNPLPTEEELSLFYRKYYRIFYQGALSKPRQKHIDKRVREAEFRAEKLKGLCKDNARVLDFGCGSGEFVEAMLNRGYDSHGFEIGESYGAYGEGKLSNRIKVSSWEDVDYAPEFDLITSFHVVEHLRDPLNAVRKMMSWLAPGGLIFLEVPNVASGPYKGFGSFHFAHVLGFNTCNLRLLGAILGLELVKEVSATGLAFKKGHGEDREVLAKNGREISAERFVEQGVYQPYFQYQFGKIAGRFTER
ncbi:MAG: class I SAM-dependent methyltransferase [Hyphomicrobiales bacterium]|nr:class I SAM-dependent methyltransferase [Hyphomicrobiales bacterium]